MKIGNEVYIHGFIDEIRQDTVIIRNNGGYFGTVLSEIIEQEPIIRCKDCRHDNNCEIQFDAQAGSEFFCGSAERREER